MFCQLSNTAACPSARSGARLPGMDAPASQPTEGWIMTDHACRHCGGRILRRRAEPRPLVMCAGCEVQAVSDQRALCARGVAIAVGPARGRHLYRCVRVEARSVHNPARVQIVFGDRALLPEGQATFVPKPMVLLESGAGDPPAAFTAIHDRDRCQICNARRDAWGWRGQGGAFHQIDPAPLIKLGIRPPANVLTPDGVRRILRVRLTVTAPPDPATLCPACSMRFMVRAGDAAAGPGHARPVQQGSAVTEPWPNSRLGACAVAP